MKRRWILLVVLVVTMTVGTVFGRARSGRRGTRPKSPPTILKCMVQIGVTQDQLAAIEALRKAAIQALKEAETREEARQIIEQLRQDIRSVLTEDQLVALAECMRPARPVTCMEQLDLTQDQIEAIDAIREAAMEAIRQATDPQAVRDIIEQMHQAIEDELTDEQLAKLRLCLRPGKPVNCMDQIDLTEEQIATIDEIRQAAMEAIKQTSDRRQIRRILDQMYEDTMAVLTDEQLEALQACRDAQRHRRHRP